jgi:hypothetical protein
MSNCVNTWSGSMRREQLSTHARRIGCFAGASLSLTALTSCGWSCLPQASSQSWRSAHRMATRRSGGPTPLARQAAMSCRWT